MIPIQLGLFFFFFSLRKEKPNLCLVSSKKYISGFGKIVADSVMYEKKLVEKSPAGAISKTINYFGTSIICAQPGRDLYQVTDLHGA